VDHPDKQGTKIKRSLCKLSKPRRLPTTSQYWTY